MPQHQPRSNRATHTKPVVKPRQLKLELLESRSVLSVSMPGGDWHDAPWQQADSRDFGPRREPTMFMDDRASGMDFGGRNDFGHGNTSGFGVDSPAMRSGARSEPGFDSFSGPRDSFRQATIYHVFVITTPSSVRSSEFVSSVQSPIRAGAGAAGSVVNAPSGPLAASLGQTIGSPSSSEDSFASAVDSLWPDSSSAVSNFISDSAAHDSSPAGGSQSKSNSPATDLALGNLMSNGQELGRITATLGPLASPLTITTLGLPAAIVDEIMASAIASDDWSDAALETRSEIRSLAGASDTSGDGGFVDLQLSLDDKNTNDSAASEARRADAARAAKSRPADAVWWAGKKRAADENTQSSHSGLSKFRDRTILAPSPWIESPSADTSATGDEGGAIELAAAGSEAPVVRAAVRPRSSVHNPVEMRLSGAVGLFRAFELGSEPGNSANEIDGSTHAERDADEIPVSDRATETRETSEPTVHRAAASALVVVSALSTILKEEEQE